VLKTRNPSLSGFAIGASMLLLIAISFRVKVAAALSPAQSANTLAGTMLAGKIQAANGKPLEGVTVSARDVEKTFTTSVFTDEQGNYFFPVLDKGRYRLWVQAVGFETERTELSLDPAKDSRVNFTLQTLDDFTMQLTSGEWMDALPGDTIGNRRLKEIVQHLCGNCHPPGLALQNRFDQAGWLKILTAMETANAGVGGWSDKRRPYITHFKEELAAYLAKMRGPGPSPMQFHPFPRPTGEGARVVMTEYDIPPGKTPERLALLNGSDWSEGTPSAFEGRGTHDVTEDLDGNAWFTSTAPNHVRTYGKIDTKTGKITNYKVDDKDGWARRTHDIKTGPDGKIWITLNGNAGTVGLKEKLDGTLGKIDPKTGKIDLFNAPPGMTPVTPLGGFVSFDGKGKVWTVTMKGALRFDPDTNKFTDFISPSVDDPEFATYGVAADARGDGWWAIIKMDRLGTSDITTGKSRELQLEPRSEMKELVTEEDRRYFEHTPRDSETSSLWAQTPRRLAGDHSGSRIWVSDLFGQNIAGVDIRSSRVKYYDLPVPYSTAYALSVDDKHQVWVTLRNSDRVGKFEPQTGKWTVYQLPSHGLECRGIFVNEYQSGNVWLASWRASKVVRMQFRTEQQLEAVQTKMTATKETIASASGSFSQTINAASSQPAGETTITGEKLFIQRCSVCHLGVPPNFKTYAPLLHKELVAARGEDAVRKTIMEGSPRMPGWKYSLRPADIDEILAYLKTVTKEEVTYRP
jgi:streptogramin lyase